MVGLGEREDWVNAGRDGATLVADEIKLMKSDDGQLTC
jgi:hypothetical protein